MLSWGSAINGELGLGGLEDAQVNVPSRVPFTTSKRISLVAPGGRHTIMLTDRGEVFTCGSNDFGQLGREGSQTRLEEVPGLAQYSVTSAAAGANHCLVVDQWGSVFSWGSDESGQLGHNQGSNVLRVPRLVKGLATMKVTSVAAGMYHSCALTSSGQLYTWGNNSKGQLGLGRNNDMVFSPSLVESLTGVPVAGVTCGGNHTLVVTRSGAVFAWGSNNHGQLGLGDTKDRMWPTQVSTLRNLRVLPAGVVAGLEHTVALTSEGGVFTWGSGRCGQLGHGSFNSETQPRKVMELMGTSVSQVAAGDRHTLAYIPSRAKLYAMGVGGSGQLGRGDVTSNSNLPQIVPGLEGRGLGSVAAGGNTSWVTVSGSVARDMREAGPGLATLDTAGLLAKVEECDKEEMMDQDLLEQIETIASSLSCINGSLLLKDHFCCKSTNNGVDLNAWRKAFKTLTSCSHESVATSVLTGMLEAMNKLKDNPPDMEALRFYLIFPLHPAFKDPTNAKEVHFPFAEKFLSLKGGGWKCVEKWVTYSPPSWLKEVVLSYKAASLQYLKLKSPDTADTQILQVLLLFLRVLSRINSENGYPVSYETFYIPQVNKLHDLTTSYVAWVQDQQRGVDVSAGFYIMNYPFMFDAEAKETILRADQAVSQQQAYHTAMIQMFLSGQSQLPYFMLLVSRQNIVQETITQLQMANTADLKKPLRVTFQDEEAEDAGGVTKEFFMLLIKEILNPDYGMFTEYEDSNLIWFNPASFEDDSLYFLIGILCGLAIYNFTIVNVPFPLILYKKLLSETQDYTLSDLAELNPTTSRSLQQLLDYRGDDVEDVFCLQFSIGQNSFGEVVQVPLKPGGNDIPVTSQNRSEYVKLYVDHVLSKSCAAQFEAFKKGFLKVVSGRVLQLFHPQELMALVVGNENYDWDVLEKTAQYKEGYTADHATIKNFWAVFHELSEEDKRKFLLYLTGSDRIPISGMSSVRITIQRTLDTAFLPVAHTCFNLLDLPEYGTREKLKFKLLQAIQCTKGFGLV